MDLWLRKLPTGPSGAARMLDVMAAYDPDDPITAFGRRQKPRSYVDFLDRDGLRGARLDRRSWPGMVMILTGDRTNATTW
jgi:hypothetical protein